MDKNNEQAIAFTLLLHILSILYYILIFHIKTYFQKYHYNIVYDELPPPCHSHWQRSQSNDPGR